MVLQSKAERVPNSFPVFCICSPLRSLEQPADLRHYLDGGNLVLSDDLIDGEQEAQKCLVLSNGHMILNGLCNFEITEMHAWLQQQH